MCWIVSDSFPQLLHSSSVFGCFKIYFLQFLVSMTLSGIAVKNSSVSANRSALISHLFDASMSAYCWLIIIIIIIIIVVIIIIIIIIIIIVVII